MNFTEVLRAILSFFFIIVSDNLFSQPISKDWFEQDPKTDSVAGISLTKAYGLLKGKTSKPVIVAVIDNGIDIEHEDLKNIIWTNTKEIPGNGIDDDHNGYADDAHGWNFRGAKDGTIIENEWAGATQFYIKWKNKYDNADTNTLSQDEKNEMSVYLKAKKQYLEKLNSKDSADAEFAYNIKFNSGNLIAKDSETVNNHFYGSPYFKLSPNLTHGTHVAGIIAAERNNQKGINGIADNVLIMPIVATTAVGDERDKDIANAIRYAVDNGARIINMSFSKVFSPDKSIVDEAIRYAGKKNVLIIHAAGNDGVNIDSAENYHYPIAIYQDGTKAGNFITVGWNRPLFDYRLAHPYSDYGKTNVDLFAPGSDVYSTIPNNGYDFKSGSSMSAPVVSGVAALLLSYFPSLSATQVKDILLQSAYKSNQLVNKPKTQMQVPFDSLSASGGIVNAYNAVKLAIDMTKK
jgi:cell wall-associated protease